MAKVYYGAGGNNNVGNGETRATRFLDYSVARSNSSSGDELVLTAGVLGEDSDNYSFDATRILGGEPARAGRLQAHSSETTRTLRTSASLTAAGNPHIMRNMTVEGRNTAGAVTTYALEIMQDSSEDLQIQVDNLECVNYGGGYAAYISHRRGRIEFNNIKLSGMDAANNMLRAVNQSNDGDETLVFNSLDLSPNDPISGTQILIEGIDNLTNDFFCSFFGMRGVVRVPASVSMTILDLKSALTAIVSNFDMVIDADDDVTSTNGLLIRGQSTGTTTRAEITGGRVYFNSPSGYAIGLGQSQIDSHITNGRVAGNKVFGKQYDDKTPHNFIIGQGTASEVKGNVSVLGYVGYLFSITDSVDARGNLAFDCGGPSLYAKGTVLANIQQNIVVSTGAVQQRSNGLLACVPQGGTDTAGCDFIDNTVIVADITKIKALAQIEDASQVCTFQSNTYIIPDTVDVSTALLFGHDTSLSVSEPNNTLAQWNAQTRVTADKIVQLPQEAIRDIIESYTPELVDRLRLRGNDLVRISTDRPERSLSGTNIVNYGGAL